METLCPLRAGNSAMLSFQAIKAVALVGAGTESKL